MVLVLYAGVCSVASIVALKTRLQFTEAGSVASSVPSAEHHRPLWIIQTGAAGVSLALVVTLLSYGSLVGAWWVVMCLLGGAAVMVLRAEEPSCLPSLQGTGIEAGLWILAVACVGLTLICHRPDADDAFYVNMAVAAADFPTQSLLRSDTLHGIKNLSVLIPVYRVHAYELWNAGLSLLTGIPAIYCFHWLSASLAALFVPLAHAKLFRLLTPKLWLWGVWITMCVLIVVGDTHRWYGNFAFVRMWQGKSIFLCVFLPLVYSYALEFALQPTMRRGVLLGAAQIAAVGCSSTALWAAPAGAVMALCCGLHLTRRSLLTLGLYSLTAVYVLSVGLYMQAEMHGGALSQPLLSESPQMLRQASVIVLGNANLRLVGIGTMCLAWACWPRGLAQRFALGIPLLAGIGLFNPYTAQWVASLLVGHNTYWRIFWAVPLPVFITLVLMTPLHFTGQTWRYVGGRIGCCVCVAVFVGLVPQFSSVSPSNQVYIGTPRLKVPTTDYMWAERLNQSVTPGSTVLAPPSISLWVPTFHDHAYPLAVRFALTMLADRFPISRIEVFLRMFMSDYVAQEVSETASKILSQGAYQTIAAMVFQYGLGRFEVSAVCLAESERAERIRTVLREARFHSTLRGEGYEIWVRHHAKGTGTE